MNRTKQFIAFLLCIVILFTGLNLFTFSAKAATTTIDLTGLSSGAENSHDCSKYLATKYDSTQHWQECTVCGSVFNKVNHNFLDNGWTLGSSEYCNPSNMHTFSCETCGFSFSNDVGRKQHQYTFIANNNTIHSNTCLNCSDSSINIERHYDAGGILGCDTRRAGICAKCNAYIDTTHTVGSNFGAMNNSSPCLTCSKSIIVNQYLTELTYDYNLNFRAVGVQIVSIDLSSYSVIGHNSGFYHGSYGTVTDYNYTILDSHTLLYSISGRFNIHDESAEPVNYSLWIQGANGEKYFICNYFYLYAENTSPIIGTISQTDVSSSNSWSTAKKITVNGAENYCNSIKLTMTDDTGNTYLKDVSVPVNNGSWSYNFIPDIEADANGKVFTITATDTLENSSQKTFTVYKTDKKMPIMTSSTETTQNWSKTKDFTFTATDTGAGNVQIAFNNTNDYALATQSGSSYSRDYTFTGDVYGNVTAAVYFKDAVGNETTKFIKVYNLDNTKPTITDTSVSVGKGTASITVTANDINTKLNASGSGVSEYGISTTEKEPTNWQTSNTLTVTKNGTYYIYAKDAVGNISTPYTITVKDITIDIEGSIKWVDNNDALGYRPKTVDIVLKRNGTEIERKTLSNSDNSFSFISLPQTDNNYNLYDYTVEQDFTSKYLVKENGEYVEKDAYNISVNNNNFTNTIIEPDNPVVPVKPDHTNTLIVKTNKKVQVILKQMESVIKKGKVSYTDNYNGFYYNFTLDSSLTLSDIPSGKYEIIVLNKDYETKEITLSDSVNTTYDGKYLIISDTNSDNKGTLNITLKDFNKKQGYQSETNRNNFWRVP